MKKIIPLLAIALLIVGAAVLVKKKIAANNTVPALSSFAMSVKTFTPHEGNVTLSTPVLALVKNDRDATLSAKFPAAVLSILPSGTEVKKGEIVVRLDNRDLAARKESLDTALDAAKNEEKAKQLALSHENESHKRTLELLAVKGASIEQSQSEESRIALLGADLAGVKAKQSQIRGDMTQVNDQLDYTLLRAPANGVVGETFAAVGDIASPGKPLAAVRASSGSYLWVRVALGTPAKTLLYDTHRAPLKFLQNNAGMDEYRADIPLSLPSGARVEAKMLTYEGVGTLLPRDAVLLKEDKAYVFVMDASRTKAQEITITARGDEGYVSSSAIKGNLVVAKPDILLKLLGGASVAAHE